MVFFNFSPTPPYSPRGARPPPPPPLPVRSSQIPPEARSRFEGVFRENSEGKPYLTGIEAAMVFMQSGLPKADLSRIWEQADRSPDGRLEMNGFIQAMWSIELQTRGNHLQPNSGSSHQPSPAYAPQASSRPSSYHSAVGPFPTPSSSSYQGANPPANSNPPEYRVDNPDPYPAPQYQFTPPPPLAYAPWHSGYPPAMPAYNAGPAPGQRLENIKMTKAMICAGCEAGILPGDTILHCEKCDNGLSYCERCVDPRMPCKHGLQWVRLEEDEGLPVRDKDGDFGLGLKCYKCKAKIKTAEICFKCSRCWDPDYCAKCWRQKDRRCKHAAKGKVKMCRSGRKADDGDEIGDLVDGIVSALGG